MQEKYDNDFYEEVGDILSPFRKQYGGALIGKNGADPFEKDPDSILNVTRNVIKWRKTHHVLNHIGTLDFIETSTPEVIAFKRTNEKGESVSLAFNFSDKPVAVKFPTNNNGQKSIIVKPYQALTTDSTPLSPLLHRQR